MKTTQPLLATILIPALLAGCQTTTGESREAPPDEAAAAEAMSAEDLEAYMATARPGAGHRILDPMGGEFRAQVTATMGPGAPPDVSTGIMRTSWTLGGRYLKHDYQGKAMGQPFSGQGYTGFDNQKQCFCGFWVDSMGTMMPPIIHGQADESGKVLTFEMEHDQMEHDHWVTGERGTTREVVTIESHDRHTTDMFWTPEEGETQQTLRIVYDRIR